ncbi:MAG: DUF3568 family protein [Betaproteobacteria bacterium]
MANSFKSFFKLSTLVFLILGLSGCAGVGLTVPAAAVSGGAAGVNYSVTNNAYKTISYPIADVETALNKALKKMDIKETELKREEDKVSISAVTDKLEISIDLEKVTPTVTKIEVSAKKEVILKDKSTATEIIVQTEKNLEVKK